MRRLVDGLLLIVVFIGGYLAWQTGLERGRLAQHYQKLVRVAGSLVVSDPSKIYVQALETGDPMHFAWRVFLPANYTENWRSSRESAGSRTSPKPSEFIARVHQAE